MMRSLRVMNTTRITANVLPSAQRLRIALVTETYSPEINGVAMTLQRMVHGLIERGHQIQLVRPRQRKDDQANTFAGFEELLVRGGKLPRYDGLRFGLPARTLLELSWTMQRPDLVHVATEGPLGWSAVTAARKLRIPVSSDFHTNFDHYSQHYGIGWLRQSVTAYLRCFHRRTERTFVPTSALVRELSKQGYRDLSVIARGVDTALYAPIRRDAELRRSWGAADDDVVLACVGRLAPEKNLALVRRIIALIEAQGLSAKMLFVGDGPMRAELQKSCPNAIFAGIRRGSDLGAHYASADVFLFPSLTETFGNVTLEAMASGLCVVAYDYAAAKEVISSGVDGLLAPPGDEDCFIESTLRTLQDRNLRKSIAAAARARAAAFSWDCVNDQFSEELLKVWRGAGKGPSRTGREWVLQGKN